MGLATIRVILYGSRAPGKLYHSARFCVLLADERNIALDRPANTDKNYGFTEWAIQLNELTPDLVGVVPPSDSRLRPDQRAYEEGRIDEADHLKTALEEAQRQRKQADGDYIKPRWFKPLPHGSGEDEWEYAGGYFESRADGSLPTKAVGGLFEL